jgi:hypothetical protein
MLLVRHAVCLSSCHDQARGRSPHYVGEAHLKSTASSLMYCIAWSPNARFSPARWLGRGWTRFSNSLHRVTVK